MNEFGLVEPVKITTTLCEHEYDGPRKTVVVLGIGQGGTSLVGAVADALGFSFSDKHQFLYNFECWSRPRFSDNEEEFFSKIKQIDSRLELWGFKYHYVFRYPTQRFHDAITNPYYLVVTKDAVSVMQRRCQGEANMALESQSLQEVIHAQNRLWDWVRQLPPAPMLGISYQRAVLYPTEFVDAMIAFLRVDISPERRERAIRRISPAGGYLTQEETSK